MDSNRFSLWMSEVDLAVSRLVGLSVHDLPDYDFRSAFDSGRKPLAVARAAIRAARD